MPVQPAKLKWERICFPFRTVLWSETEPTHTAGAAPVGYIGQPCGQPAAGYPGAFPATF